LRGETMKYFRVPLCLLLLLVGGVCYGEKVESPDGRVELYFDVRDESGCGGCPVYRVAFAGKPVVGKSRLGLTLAGGIELDSGFELVSSETSTHDSEWKPVYGERSVVRDHYNRLSVRMKHSDKPGYTLEIVFRCYNAGVAFNYTIDVEGDPGGIEIVGEGTEFQFLRDHPAWQVSTAQGIYELKPLSRMWTEVERPLTIRIDGDIYAAVTEAKLVDYARMKLGLDRAKPPRVVSRLGGNVRASLPLTTPWRVIMMAESPGKLLENNDIILNLNDPPEIEDTSWIMPGKVIREVTLTTAGGKACVDFAAAHNLQFIEFDAGWYGPENDAGSDATTVTLDPKRSSGPLDLPGVIRYAGDRGIGVILYVNHRALERQLDELLPLYRDWGVSGLKYGFVNVGPQEWTSWLHDAVRKTAGYRMMVDVHDEYRPTGYSRTYPNLMTQEGIAGDETSPENSQTLAILFTRMLAGAGDNTICYYDSRVDENATHAYQLAKAVVFYSPWQFLYWYDRPPDSPREKGGAGGEENIIGDEPELEFYDSVPTVWDDTKVIHGSIGEYAVIARRSGENWFIGGMNAGEARTLEVPLDFLDPGTGYVAHIYSDDNSIDTRTRVRIDRFAVNAGTVLAFAMGENGGQAVRLVPAAAGETFPEYR